MNQRKKIFTHSTGGNSFDQIISKVTRRSWIYSSNWLYGLLLLLGPGGCGPERKSPDVEGLSWPQLEAAARGSTVNLVMWQGDPYINGYVNNFVVPHLRKAYGIELRVSGGQGGNIVSILSTEKDAGKTTSAVDLTWINGETFYQLRQIDALYGPFTQRLPNGQYVDFANPFIGYDFGQEVKGFECPWGNVQLCLIYDRDRVADPPQTMEALETWVKNHPGRFTIGNDFTGMTLLKGWLIHLAGNNEALKGPFDEAKYRRYSADLWAYVNRLKPYLWKEGKTFPSSVAQMHQLFAGGELDFTVSNNDGEVDNKVLQGLFPATTRAYVPENGSIQNTHYLGIVKHSGNRAGAMVVCNFLISPGAQLEKYNPKVWGDGTVLDVGKLPAAWQVRFRSLPERRYAPKREGIQARALAEPAPEYMIRLYEDFRKRVIES